MVLAQIAASSKVKNDNCLRTTIVCPNFENDYVNQSEIPLSLKAVSINDRATGNAHLNTHLG